MVKKLARITHKNSLCSNVSAPTLIDCFIVRFDRANAKDMVICINTKCPLPRNIHHLKRIRPCPDSKHSSLLEMIVAPCDGLGLDQFKDVYGPDLQVNQGIDTDYTVGIVAVPQRPALDKHQWTTAYKHLWPTIFHHNKHSEAQEQALKEEHDKLEEFLIKYNDSDTLVRIIDPVTGDEIVVHHYVYSGCIELEGNPMNHVVMLLIKRYSLLLNETDNDNNYSFHDRKRPLNDNDSIATSISSLNSLSSYLLTGMAVICPFEPCLMCSMALLHSRIKILVINTTILDVNGPITKHDLHEQQGLNHHFRVYRRVCDNK